MDKIRVYKTYNAADMAAIEPLLKGILRSFPDFAIGSTSIEVNNDGTWYAMADMSLVKGLPPSIKIKNEQDAFAIAQKWMQKFDEKLSGRVHDAQLPSRLFDGDLLPISATPTLKEINGLKIPSEWLCNYKLQVKPSNLLIRSQMLYPIELTAPDVPNSAPFFGPPPDPASRSPKAEFYPLA